MCRDQIYCVILCRDAIYCVLMERHVINYVIIIIFLGYMQNNLYKCIFKQKNIPNFAKIACVQ
jgi:hypothetical protein